MYHLVEVMGRAYLTVLVCGRSDGRSVGPLPLAGSGRQPDVVEGIWVQVIQPVCCRHVERFPILKLKWDLAS